MTGEFKEGDRVRHTLNPHWGIGVVETVSSHDDQMTCSFSGKMWGCFPHNLIKELHNDPHRKD